jgi:hypothetical protein
MNNLGHNEANDSPPSDLRPSAALTHPSGAPETEKSPELLPDGSGNTRHSSAEKQGRDKVEEPFDAG